MLVNKRHFNLLKNDFQAKMMYSRQLKYMSDVLINNLNILLRTKRYQKINYCHNCILSYNKQLIKVMIL